MKIYLYNEPVFGDDGNLINNIIIEKTEKEILDIFWDTWHERMVDKYGHNHELITEQTCIEDWVTIHWAWEKKND
jgi:hypothetical protein